MKPIHCNYACFYGNKVDKRGNLDFYGVEFCLIRGGGGGGVGGPKCLGYGGGGGGGGPPLLENPGGPQPRHTLIHVWNPLFWSSDNHIKHQKHHGISHLCTIVSCEALLTQLRTESIYGSVIDKHIYASILTTYTQIARHNNHEQKTDARFFLNETLHTEIPHIGEVYSYGLLVKEKKD